MVFTVQNQMCKFIHFSSSSSQLSSVAFHRWMRLLNPNAIEWRRRWWHSPIFRWYPPRWKLRKVTTEKTKKLCTKKMLENITMSIRNYLKKIHFLFNFIYQRFFSQHTYIQTLHLHSLHFLEAFFLYNYFMLWLLSRSKCSPIKCVREKKNSTSSLVLLARHKRFLFQA